MGPHQHHDRSARWRSSETNAIRFIEMRIIWLSRKYFIGLIAQGNVRSLLRDVLLLYKDGSVVEPIYSLAALEYGVHYIAPSSYVDGIGPLILSYLSIVIKSAKQNLTLCCLGGSQ